MKREVAGIEVRGVDVDSETRCAHYDSERDVVALKFVCCETYWPCFRCHEELAGHSAERFSVDGVESVVLCGVCGAELTAREFVEGSHSCPECGAAFNPGCAEHYELYFDPEE
ncbi:CHY zinc finger protein [Halorussus halophilus]|uniref:CHY zinc finger protein n=1 Tax=Halorussus halophilus TaxID=2650975 RepID=UPI001300D6BD|nr:CHY zinc finger protein [Halorussus halophilus]